MHKVFVYGTLKKGHGNHRRILQGFQEYPAVAPKIDLHLGSAFPYAVRGNGDAIGEIYEIDDATLEEIDILEGHPRFYQRELSPVILDNGETIQAWVYLREKGRRYPLVPGGNWISAFKV